MNVVITGTSRGIGLEMTLLGLMKGHRVMALARSPEKSKGLLQLKGEYKDKLEIVTGDVASAGTAETMTAMARDWGSVDILVNNAGIYRKGTDRSEFVDSFVTNAIAPFEITQAFLPLLQKSQQPKVVQITSLMGSVADNRGGSHYAYRSSKAALNMINRSLAIDNPWLISLVVHPGWVQTEMGGAEAPTSARESADGIWRVVEASSKSMSGSFVDFTGKSLPW